MLNCLELAVTSYSDPRSCLCGAFAYEEHNKCA